VITQRGYVATRLGLEALTAQLYREAISRGLGQAQQVLVIADGAVWIWNLVKDRFPEARQQLDLYHADEHLWAVANELYGRGTPEARDWVAPMLQQIARIKPPLSLPALPNSNLVCSRPNKKTPNPNRILRTQRSPDAIQGSDRCREACAAGTATAEQLKLANQPLGSGAIESTCRQYQCRFKRTGQFWTTVGDEALMCLETFWRNNRWHELYPHAKASAALN